MRNFATVFLSATLAATPLSLHAQPDRYSSCSFYPQGAGCDQAYQQALTDKSPEALLVREAFQKYARYLKLPAAELTPEDQRWLKENSIRLPALNAANRSGLHHLLHDESLKENEAKQAAANNFIGRAVEAELYCSLNGCEPATPDVS